MSSNFTPWLGASTQIAVQVQDLGYHSELVMKMLYSLSRPRLQWLKFSSESKSTYEMLLPGCYETICEDYVGTLPV